MDQWAGDFLIEQDVTFDLYLPAPPENYTGIWGWQSTENLQRQVRAARNVIVVEEQFSISSLFTRSNWMVDQAEILIAFVLPPEGDGGSWYVVDSASYLRKPVYFGFAGDPLPFRFDKTPKERFASRLPDGIKKRVFGAGEGRGSGSPPADFPAGSVHSP